MYSNIPVRCTNDEVEGTIPHKFIENIITQIYDDNLDLENKHLWRSSLEIWSEKLNDGTNPATFDNWSDGWLEDLRRTVVNLGLQLGGYNTSGSTFGDANQSYVPNTIILAELEKIIAMVNKACEIGVHSRDNVPTKGWASQCLFSMNVSNSAVMQSYTELLIVGSNYESNMLISENDNDNSSDSIVADDLYKLQLLESSCTVVVEWIRHSMTSNLHNSNGGSGSRNGRNVDVEELRTFLQKNTRSSSGGDVTNNIQSQSHYDRFLQVALDMRTSLSSNVNSERINRLNEAFNRIQLLEKQFSAND